ncbi:uncharacterized protein BT62DRAFT_1072780 [Guyanagaster necrorhizus]|uniref:Exopolyphosphatase n=1 Tax=Guyanagaster necrorhizus TaxID=856835 RepID=A0A9P8AWN3_9AGAR|nr:uncharacterized protein BT62DRAFT_1072780 [Guyanagaster necrorhizus MCA 3950]KAG7450753.1 hypothetical protein BT62DRAFT_1072780 [Guyanagaster necrorhizus MCA 3950]
MRQIFTALTLRRSRSSDLQLKQKPWNRLGHFLSESKQSFLAQVLSETPTLARDWRFVIGNEISDLDSIACSIVYSWVYAWDYGIPSVALIRSTKGELSLRPENLYALQLAGVYSPEDQLLLLDDLEHEISTPGSFPVDRLILVDHNRVDPMFVSGVITTEPTSDGEHLYGNSVIERVIDHHSDEGLYTRTAERTIATAGSCASLVTFLCPEWMPPEPATLLLCAILLDTNGLKDNVEQVDIDAVVFLLPRSILQTTCERPSPDIIKSLPEVQALTAELMRRRLSLSHLTPLDLLRRDYQEYGLNVRWYSPPVIRIGISCVPSQAKKSGLMRASQKHLGECGLAIIAILIGQKLTVLIFDRDGQSLKDRVWQGLEMKFHFKQQRMLRIKPLPVGMQQRIYTLPAAEATREFIEGMFKHVLEG